MQQTAFEEILFIAVLNHVIKHLTCAWNSAMRSKFFQTFQLMQAKAAYLTQLFTHASEQYPYLAAPGPELTEAKRNRL